MTASAAQAARRSRFLWAALIAATFFTTSTLTRLILLALNPVGIAAGLEAIARGAVFDLLVALMLAAPMMLYVGLLRRRWYAGRAQQLALRLFLAIAVGVALFVAVAEVLFFEEFTGRFNFVAVDYLIFPTEVVTNVWESYPVAWVLLGIALVAVAAPWTLRRRLDVLRDPRDVGRAGRVLVLAGYGASLALLTIAVRPSLAHVSENRVANELAANGYYTFWGALLGQDAPYEGLYATRDDCVVFPRLQRLLTEPATDTSSFRPGSTERRVLPASEPRRLNVVVVLEESLGSSLVGATGPADSASLTPHFDSLAAGGALLTHAYSTGNRTIRALEATSASLPPLPGISIVRRPASADLFTLASVLGANGYSTQFIYGGRALFDGVGAYMRKTGMQSVVEQKDYPAGSFATAWGVADEVIFDKALAEIDARAAAGKPTYTEILTVSNHKPYTYPAGRIPFDPGEHRRTFAVRYADWALGRFIREARSHPWFGRTIFVLMGDHGARVYGAAEIPLPSYEVPILFYGPGLVQAGVRVNTLASSLDVPPTILGMLGVGYESKFFGRDVFRSDSAAGRALMTHNNEVALLRGERIVVLGLQESETVYSVDSAGGFRLVAAPDSADRELIEDAVAYYTGADRLYRSGRYRFDDSAARRPLAGVATGHHPEATVAATARGRRASPASRRARFSPDRPDARHTAPLETGARCSRSRGAAPSEGD